MGNSSFDTQQAEAYAEQGFAFPADRPPKLTERRRTPPQSAVTSVPHLTFRQP